MNRSILIALGIFAVLTVYMLTGLIGCAGGDSADAAVPAEKKLMTVQVREMEAEVIPREIVLTGKTVPSRRVELKAETAGKVIAAVERRGMPIREGELIAEIEMRDRRERLEQAKAALEQAEFEYEAGRKLAAQDLRSAAQVAEALARLRGAEQHLRATEIDIRDTRLLAPFDGILQERMVEVGDYLIVGDPVALVIDTDPIVVEGEATEFQIEYLEIGEEGHALLSDGHTVDGRLTYVAGESDPMSRTFPVELEVPNPDHSIPAGVTARIAIETERVPAYRISPALISISDDGEFGVKIVDEEDVVQFHKADIVKSEPEWLWLTGLPEKIRLITVGQGFTQAGDRVEVERETGHWN